MRQRLVLSSALIHNPKVIIVDEPVVGLDPKGSRLVKTVFKNLTHEKVTVFLSTHVLSIAEELCDRIAIIHEGKMIALGTMEELQNKGDEGLESLFLRLTGGEEVSESLAALNLRVP
jgi:ABC-2 type transport system ATP-binding protein